MSRFARDFRRRFSASIRTITSTGVYIDGNHQYEFVKADVELCFRKVRLNGTIAGDDFFWKRSGRMHVRDAVIDVLSEKKIEAERALSRIGQQFMISVVEKDAKVRA